MVLVLQHDLNVFIVVVVVLVVLLGGVDEVVVSANVSQILFYCAAGVIAGVFGL